MKTMDFDSLTYSHDQLIELVQMVFEDRSLD